MPDLSAPVGALLDVFGPLFRVAIGTLLRTALGMALLVSGICTAAVYLAYGDPGSWTRALLAGGFGLALGGVLTGILAIKRAVGRALLHGVAKLKVAQRVVSLLFDKVLSLDAAGVHGERGIQAAHLAERVPLKQAEERLRAAVRGVAGQIEGAGFLRRKLIETLLGKISSITLHEFREQAHHHGGVDLVKVRALLEPRIDGAIADLIEGTLMKFTVSIVFGFSLVSLVFAYVLRGLPI